MDEKQSGGGRYIYCIAAEPFREKYGNSSIQGFESEVSTVRFRDICAVVGSLPPDLCKVNATRKNVLTHQRVMEDVMKDTTVLPVKFGTVAESSGNDDPEERIKNRVLKERHQELAELLAEMEGKVELGLKALWADMKMIYSEIVAENPRIAALRSKVDRLPENKSYQSKITLGRLVKDALDEKRAWESMAMIKTLKEACVDSKETNTFGDQMIVNGAFLVKSELEDEFDKRVEELMSSNDGRVIFRCLGPVPPCNFVELVITWG